MCWLALLVPCAGLVASPGRMALPQPRLLRTAPLRLALPAQQRSWLATKLLGDPTRSPLKQAIKQQLKLSKAPFVPPELIDMALDQALALTEQLVPGGLQSTLLEPGALQKQRGPLQREMS